MPNLPSQLSNISPSPEFAESGSVCASSRSSMREWHTKENLRKKPSCFPPKKLPMIFLKENLNGVLQSSVSFADIIRFWLGMEEEMRL